MCLRFPRSLHESQQPMRENNQSEIACKFTRGLSSPFYPVHDHMSPTDSEVRSTKISRYSFIRGFIRVHRFTNLSPGYPKSVRRVCHFTVPPQVRTKIMFTCAMTFISRRRDVKNTRGRNRRPNGAACMGGEKKVMAYRYAREKKMHFRAHSSSYESFRRNAPLSLAAR